MGSEVRVKGICESTWLKELADVLASPPYRALEEFVRTAAARGPVYPPEDQVFAAFDRTPFDRVKVVILGQDPYHNPGQAHGLCFSVPDGVRPPPSLVNVYKELEAEYGEPFRGRGGNLSAWADQGVFLLNATLTVAAHRAGSHQGRGWETFTDAVVRALAEQREHLVFILWGSYAQKKGAFIDRSRHCVICSAHPSPLSAYRGFFGSKPFSKANAYLKANGIGEIAW